MVSGGEAVLETDVILPAALGYHQLATIFVEYANTGDVAMPAPLLRLTATQNGDERAFLTLDQSRLTRGFWTSSRPEGFTTSVQFLATGETPGVLQPGESIRVPVYWAGWQQPWDFSYPPFIFEIGTLTTDSTEVVNWDNYKEGMRPDGVSSEAWDIVFQNVVGQVGGTWGELLTTLNEDAAHLGRLGHRVIDLDALLLFEVQKAQGLSPVFVLSNAIDAVVTSPGVALAFVRTYQNLISSRFRSGDLGHGWFHIWEATYSEADDGTISVDTGAFDRKFQPDIRGGYFSAPGDYGVLNSLGGGRFKLTEPKGLDIVFDGDGKVEFIEDFNGNRISTNYVGGQLASLDHTNGGSLEFSYNVANLIETITDTDGHQATFTYDLANLHLTSVEYDDGRVFRYSYDASPGSASLHALTEIEYPDGTHEFFTYDAAGRLASTNRDDNSSAVDFTYNHPGSVAVTDSNGAATEYFFDHRSQISRIEDPLENSTRFFTDGNFNLTFVADTLGRTYEFDYDDAGNIIGVTDPLGRTVGFRYSVDPQRITSVTDGNDNLTQYTYDQDGNRVSVVDVLANSDLVQYNDAGDPISRTNRRGGTVGYEYDASGRLTAIVDGAARFEYTYDVNGNLTQASNPAGTTAFTYDGNEFLTRIAYPGGQTLDLTYDAAGRRTSTTDHAGHTVNYEYDSAGRIASLTDGTDERVRYTYDALGRVTRLDRASGVDTTMSYDVKGRLQVLTNLNSDDTTLSSFSYEYNTQDAVIRKTTSDGEWTYEYDALDQLTGAVFTSTNSQIPNQDIVYSYDAAGNRIRTISNGAATDYTVNALNQYTQVGDTSYLHDADGNLVSKVAPGGTTTYTYNAFNQVTAVTGPEGNWQFTYDALGVLISATKDGVETQYLVDPIGLGDVVGEYDDSGATIANYVYGYGLVGRVGSGGDEAFYTFDGFTNTAELTDGAGAS